MWLGRNGGKEPRDEKVVECFQEGVGLGKKKEEKGSAPPLIERTFIFCPPHAWASRLATSPDACSSRTNPGLRLSRDPERPSLPTSGRTSRPEAGSPDATMPAARSTASAAFSPSVCQTVGGNGRGAASRLPRAPFWGVRKGNFGELGGEECGAKWHERRNVPRSRFRTPVESRRRGRAGAGAGAGPGRAGFRAAAARRGGARGPQVQFPVLPRGGAGAADQVTERSSGAAGSRLVLSRRRRRRRRRRHT